MAIVIKPYRVSPKKSVNLHKCPTLVKPLYQSKDDYAELLQTHRSVLSELQDKFYAKNEFSLLLIFQGMDTSGKDGTIAHVMSGLNPQACRVSDFKRPSETELKHDFLWRCTLQLPERGQFGIFNRSYYEELMVARVHPEVLRAEGPIADRKHIWKERYHSILEFEKHLWRNQTIIVKFFLHISRSEQKKRLLARLDDPKKMWKIDKSDFKERHFWKEYQDSYSDCLSHTSSKHSPWYIVPADDKLNARLIVSEIIAEHLRSLKVDYPHMNKERRRELERFRKDLLRS